MSWSAIAFGITLLISSAQAEDWPRFASPWQPSDRRRLESEGELTESEDDMWGGCLENLETGHCELQGDLTCDSFLSDGPEDADIELVVDSLPPSEPGQPVYLHWWAAHKSRFPYRPLEGPWGSGVFRDFRHAYPSHSDVEDFNGGNVQVDSNGTATIRVRQPACYVVNKWILFPHIHLRLCSGDRFSHSTSDTIFFTRDGPTYASGFHGPDHDLGALSSWAPRYANETSTPSSNVSGVRISTTTIVPQTTSTVHDRNEDSNPSEDVPGASTSTISIVPQTTSTVRDRNEDTNPSEDVPGASTSTTSFSPQSTTNVDSEEFLENTDGFVDLRVQDAVEALDIDALEFSPVYQCLLSDRFFSYFNSSCVESCPSDSVVHVGQCVRPEVDSQVATVQAAWQLELECGEHCFHSKLGVTMHHLRLMVADKLNVPFQEVVRAALVQVSRRRLEAGAPSVVRASLHVVVNSTRIDPAVDEGLLKNLVSDATGAEWLLGFVVHDVEPLSVDENTETGETIVTVTTDSDPYGSAYDAAAQREEDGGIPIPGVESATVPVWLFIAIALVIVLAIASYSVFVYRRRRKQRMDQSALGVPVVEGQRPADDDGHPTKPNTVGVSNPDDADYPKKPHNNTAASSSHATSHSAAATDDAHRV